MGGEIETIEYKSKTNINDSPGGALSNASSKPKDVHIHEDKVFVSGLTPR